MAEPEYAEVGVTPEVNPCYGVTSCDSATQDVSKLSSFHKAKKAKEPSRDLCKLISLILIGTVAAVSLAVAVWSVAKVNAIHTSCVSNTEVRDSINELNITFTSFYETVRSRININSINELNTSFTLFSESVQNRIDVLNVSSADALDLLQVQLSAVSQALLGKDSYFPATSCYSIFFINPSTPSGHYWVRASNGSAVRVYCDMTRSCGGVTGGWMRVTSLNFSTDSVSCPNGLQERNAAGIHTCEIQSSGKDCASVLFGTSQVAYTQVCGKVLAYQSSSTDGFGDFGRRENLTIDSNYVDGVSLTYGSNPRKHIWTFAAAIDEYGEKDHEAICECSHSGCRGEPSPPFVRQDYFCDSGTTRFTSSDGGRFFGDSPLWDGAGCGPNSTCCSFNNPPWFHKQLPSPTSDAIEMRVCRDEARSNEDIAVSSVEIYVRRDY